MVFYHGRRANPYQSRPGWIAFVENECSDREYVNPDYDWCKTIMRQIMYRFETAHVDCYYHLGYSIFEFQVIRRIERQHHANPAFIRPANLRPYISYFYNRQLIIQMTSIPHFYPGQKLVSPYIKTRGA